MRSLFVLHRDFSVDDNLGLLKCINESGEVHVVFIFTPEQADPKQNNYFSNNSFAFLLGCLEELSKEIHVSFFYEKSAECIKRLVKKYDIQAVWENRDFSAFAREREAQHKELIKSMGCSYNLCDSITLLPMGLLNRKDSTYIKFTPFYKNAQNYPISKPQHGDTTKISKQTLDGEIHLSHFKKYFNEDLFIKPGRKSALKLLKDFIPNVKNYEANRNYPARDYTSHLSPHLHFGTITPREVYWTIKNEVPGKAGDAFLQQIYWREFYMYIVNYVAKTYIKKSWTMEKFNNIKWVKNDSELKKWQMGQTKIPIVDAGMRQLLKTGYMHNRLRMICAMYLIHYLGIHWKEGEQWFAQNLIDYSYANNYGGWVWCAGTEIHANQYFRTFAMDQQHIRFDKECKYVKLWCPELSLLSLKQMLPLYNGLSDIRKKRIAYLKTC